MKKKLSKSSLINLSRTLLDPKNLSTVLKINAIYLSSIQTCDNELKIPLLFNVKVVGASLKNYEFSSFSAFNSQKNSKRLLNYQQPEAIFTAV